MSTKEATAMRKTVQKRITNVATQVRELPKQVVKKTVAETTNAVVDQSKKVDKK